MIGKSPIIEEYDLAVYLIDDRQVPVHFINGFETPQELAEFISELWSKGSKRFNDLAMYRAIQESNARFYNKNIKKENK